VKTVTRFPHSYTETEDCWIPMPDGARLAAKLWLPDIAKSKRVPAIIELLPYRKRDIYAPRDAMHHRYFAGHGYACMRIDIRGSGDSDGQQGVFAIRQDQEDSLEVLKWIAAQPWSDGQVGIFGISWGGFAAIQTAHRAPPELKAIVPCEFAPDRYVYSQVYRGGCVLLARDPVVDATLRLQVPPPDPALVGERWRSMWLERLESNVPQIVSSLQHQNYGEYWKSRAIDFERIRCPFYAGGRLGGRLLRGRGRRSAAQTEGAAERPHRTVGTPLSPSRRTGSGDRFPAGDAALVRSLDARQGYRRRKRSRADGLDAAGGAGKKLLSGIARALGGGAAMAVAAHQVEALRDERGRESGRTGGAPGTGCRAARRRRWGWSAGS
jgi:pimeloyl-ACP methyl ester carboxylesterase